MAENKWVTRVITAMSGVETLLITGRGKSCVAHRNWLRGYEAHQCPLPRRPMYDLFTYVWVVQRIEVGKCTKNGVSGFIIP